MAFLIKPVAACSDSTSFPVGNRNRCQTEPIESRTGSTHIILFLIFLVFWIYGFLGLWVFGFGFMGLFILGVCVYKFIG